MNIPSNSLLETAPLASNQQIIADRKSFWVCCFGFPLGQGLALIQQHFIDKGISVLAFYPNSSSQLGEVNYIHVKLKTQKDVALALGENGRVLSFNGAQVMIGVSTSKDGEQLDNLLSLSSSTSTSISISNNVEGGPRRVSSFWDRARIWILDL